MIVVSLDDSDVIGLGGFSQPVRMIRNRVVVIIFIFMVKVLLLLNQEL